MVGLVIVFVVVWIGIFYEIKTAPTVDEFGNIIKDNNQKQNNGNIKKK
jgi:hypothetical protein|tara:strand:+ start:1906 stop:2049 length:144 start_codon:yes stop_codon:yes gene_type:complete